MDVAYLGRIVMAVFIISFAQGQTVGGNSDGAPCVFPFKYRNKLYTSCINSDHTALWCSTTENYDKNKKWGECQDIDYNNMPFFDNTTKTVVIAVVGEMARLPCVVRNLGSKQTSWLKKDTLFPLTVATKSFLNDGRYIVESGGKDEWNLIITNVQRSDRGIYLCKVTTRSISLIREVKLYIKGSRREAIIATPFPTGFQQEGQKNLDVGRGSKLTLFCNSTVEFYRKGTHQSQSSLFWFKDSIEVNADAKSGVEILNMYRDEMAYSRLIILKMRSKNEGIYYCVNKEKTVEKFNVTMKRNTAMVGDGPKDDSLLYSTSSTELGAQGLLQSDVTNNAMSAYTHSPLATGCLALAHAIIVKHSLLL